MFMYVRILYMYIIYYIYKRYYNILYITKNIYVYMITYSKYKYLHNCKFMYE